MGVVDVLVATHYAHLPVDVRADLRQEGYLGLIHAAEVFDEARGAFLTLARTCAHGRIRDYIRRQPAHNRYEWRRVHVGQLDGGGLEIVTPELGVTPARLARMRTALRVRLREDGRSLRDVEMVLRYFCDGVYHRAIAREFGVSEGRACQIVLRVGRDRVVDWMLDVA